MKTKHHGQLALTSAISLNGRASECKKTQMVEIAKRDKRQQSAPLNAGFRTVGELFIVVYEPVIDVPPETRGYLALSSLTKAARRCACSVP